MGTVYSLSGDLTISVPVCLFLAMTPCSMSRGLDLIRISSIWKRIRVVRPPLWGYRTLIAYETMRSGPDISNGHLPCPLEVNSDLSQRMFWSVVLASTIIGTMVWDPYVWSVSTSSEYIGTLYAWSSHLVVQLLGIVTRLVSPPSSLDMLFIEGFLLFNKLLILSLIDVF